MAKLTKEDFKKRKKYHEKRAEYYQKKIDQAEKSDRQIGFRYNGRQ